jgi:hypothetical protein
MYKRMGGKEAKQTTGRVGVHENTKMKNRVGSEEA